MSSGQPLSMNDRPISFNKLPANGSVPTKTPRSMLRNLFNWKRSSSTQDGEDLTRPNSVADDRPHTSDSGMITPTLSRKPSFSQRSRSENIVPQRSKSRSKSRRRSRSRCRAVWDPPPLFQAYNQACMHDSLLIPNRSFLDWLPRNGSGRANTKHSDRTEEDGDEIRSPSRGHRRSASDSSSSSLSKKLFFLFENGYILQYKEDGSQDRLPERVIELSRDSLAFASDAIAGQHWVLEVCPHGKVDPETKALLSKLSWSRMTLKSPDTKRLSEKLLLVFENPDALFEWLFAIRKQIECLGGIEYQPDAPPLPETDFKRATLRHASSDYFKRKTGGLAFSRSSSALPLKLDNHSAHEKDLPQIPAHFVDQRSVSVRSTTTSVITNTSLDRLRESYSGSISTGTALSSDLSPTSPSPIKDTFAPLLPPVIVRESRGRAVDRSIPKTPSSPLFNSEGRSPSPDETKSFENNSVSSTTAKETSPQSNKVEPIATSPVVVVPQVIIALDTETVGDKHTAPEFRITPVPELRKRLRMAHQNLSLNDANTQTASDRPTSPSTKIHHVPKPSLGSSAKGTYGLFPKKLALDIKTEPLVIPDRNNVPGLLRTQATDHLEMTESPITPVASAFATSLFARSHTTFKRPTAITLPHLLATVELDQPMRSPAVTDAMLDSNFGTMPTGLAAEPSTPVKIRVPSFSDIRIDQSLIESVREIQSHTDSPPESPKSRNLTPRRSLPNFHYGSTNNLISAPVGPPPSGPLPAVPPLTDGRNSRNSTPGKRTSVQSSANRRASTKSAASTKKVRSPAPSFSFAGSQARVSLPPGVRSPIVAESQNVSPIETASPVLSEKSGFTIGQVSIVSAPPTRSLVTSSHKKSLSTSSINSNTSGKLHLRKPSARSLHSVTHLPSITNLISPPCGIESDFDLGGKSCFGLSGSRSST